MSELALEPEVENPYAGIDIQNLIDTRYQIDLEKREAAKRERDLKKEIDLIDEILWKYHEDNPEVAMIMGSQAKISWSEEEQFSTEAGKKEEVRDWLFEHGHQYLMTWHLNRASTAEFIGLHGELPHVTSYMKKKVSCTKV